MDPVALLSAVIALTAAAPVVRRVRQTRAAQRDAIRYLESLLVEARSSSFPVTARHI